MTGNFPPERVEYPHETQGGTFMDWTQSIRTAIDEMEKHLLDEDCVEKACRAALVSPLYLQQGFRIMTGLSMAEYVRCRRLYKAALDIAGEAKVIDTALKYGWDTPESFTKAFSRFHGVSPMQVKKDTHHIRSFLPLRVSITIQGGNDMDFTIEKKPEMQLIGIAYEVAFENSYQTIPAIWSKLMQDFQASSGNAALRQAITAHRIGEFALCMDHHPEQGTFTYLIAGLYQGGNVPEGMRLHTLPEMDWAVFPCVGPLPGALQSLNTKIFREWLPGNNEYRIASDTTVEWYAEGDGSDENYRSAIWVPVKAI